MAGTFLVGRNVCLRGISERDIGEDSPYFRWMNDLQLDVYTERSYVPMTPERMRAHFERVNRYDDLIQLGIFHMNREKHIGNVSFSAINHYNRRAYIGYLLGDREFQGQGLITEAVLMFMYYGFNKLNFERIHGGVSSAHPASQRVCEKVGLIEEGRQRRHLYRNGRWHDDIIVGALRDEWMATHGAAARELFINPPT